MPQSEHRNEPQNSVKLYVTLQMEAQNSERYASNSPTILSA